MPFAKALSRANGGYRLTVTANGGNTDDTAVMVAAVVRRDRFMDVESMNAAPGGTALMTSALPDSLIRVIIWVNLPIPNLGGVVEATVSLAQELGGGAFNARILEDTMFVFDIVP